MSQRLLLAAVAALLSSACSGTEPGPLHVTMRLDKVAVAIDDSIRVTLDVVNTSTAPVMVYPSSAYGPCVFSGFELFDSEWRRAQETYYCALATTFIYLQRDPVPLGPGQSIEIITWWHPDRTQLDGEPIEPGRYRIRGAAAAPDGITYTQIREILVGG